MSMYLTAATTPGGVFTHTAFDSIEKAKEHAVRMARSGSYGDVTVYAAMECVRIEPQPVWFKPE